MHSTATCAQAQIIFVVPLCAKCRKRPADSIEILSKVADYILSKFVVAKTIAELDDTTLHGTEPSTLAF